MKTVKSKKAVTAATKRRVKARRVDVQRVDVPHAELNRLISAAETRTMDARKALGMAVEAIFQLEHALLMLANEAARMGHIDQDQHTGSG